MTRTTWQGSCSTLKPPEMIFMKLWINIQSSYYYGLYERGLRGVFESSWINCGDTIFKGLKKSFEILKVEWPCW